MTLVYPPDVGQGFAAAGSDSGPIGQERVSAGSVISQFWRCALRSVVERDRTGLLPSGTLWIGSGNVRQTDAKSMMRVLSFVGLAMG